MVHVRANSARTSTSAIANVGARSVGCYRYPHPSVSSRLRPQKCAGLQNRHILLPVDKIWRSHQQATYFACRVLAKEMVSVYSREFRLADCSMCWSLPVAHQSASLES